MPLVAKKVRKPLEEDVNFKRSEVERISNLPSSVIGHILSFLPTKYAVATSDLSTKWKHFWTLITKLDFDDDLSKHLRKSKRRQSVKTSFINFVYQVMLHNVSDLLKFGLRCNQSYDVSHLKAWLSTAISRNVRQLDLFVSLEGGHIELPRGLFTCPTLVVLKLGARCVLNVPTLVRLPSLKIIHLDKIKFSDGDSIDRLFSSCPLLEDLFLILCDQNDISVFNISALALRSLIINCYGIGDFNYKIVLNTPNLQHLKYDGRVAEGYLVNNLNSSVRANINLSRTYLSKDLAVSQLSRVQRLHLSGDSVKIHDIDLLTKFSFLIKVLQSCSYPLPKFHSLTYLEIEHVKWKFLLDLLDSSLQLETLTFWGISHPYHDEDYPSLCCRPENVPRCLWFHLKVIKISSFAGKDYEMKMVQYFLKNAKVLKKLKLHPSSVEDLEVYNKLLMLARVSKTCAIELF